MATGTTKYGLQKPAVGADADVWGSHLNNNLDDTDVLLGAITTTGSANAYVLTSGLSLAAYVSGQSFIIKPNFANTGAATINVDSLGAKDLRKNGTTALASGDLATDQYYRIVYNGTQFQVVGLLASGVYQPIDATLTALAAGATGADVLFYWSGSDTLSTTTLTSAARNILDDTTVAAICVTLGAAQLTANNTLSGSNTLSGLNTTTNQSRRHEAATPVEVTKDTGGGSNAKVWRRYAQSSNLIFDCLNDAENSATTWLTVARSGQTPVSATFGCPIKARPAISTNTGGTLTSASDNAIVDLATAPTINDGVHEAGSIIVLVNNTASSMTITQDTGMTLRLHGTTTTGNRTLNARGIATIQIDPASNAEAIVSGDVS